MTKPRDWLAWHQPYDDPGSSLSRRLLRVQHRLRQALDSSLPGPIRILSMCAGQGRDLLVPLAAHPRRDDVRAVLVEADRRNCAEAARAVREKGLAAQVEVLTGDASVTDAYAPIVPADIALVCGVFGNITTSDIEFTIAHLATLLSPAATVIWTRHRRDPDLTPAIRTAFTRALFDEIGFDTEAGYLYGVGSHRLAGPALSFSPGVRLFRFDGDGGDASV